MRSVLPALPLSLAIALTYVLGANLGPGDPSLSGPFANLHGGYPRGLPSYGESSSGGLSSGSFEGNATTADAPGTVLAFYERSIDRSIWTITSVGSRWLIFYDASDPAIRGGVEASPYEGRTIITVWVTDFQLPPEFPRAFPGGHRASPVEPPSRDGDTYILRWGIAGNASEKRFVEDFSQVLSDAGWDVAIGPGQYNVPSLTCRSRAQPTLGCRLTVTFETIRNPRVTYQTSVASIRVGPGADR